MSTSECWERLQLGVTTFPHEWPLSQSPLLPSSCMGMGLRLDPRGHSQQVSLEGKEALLGLIHPAATPWAR